MLEDEIIVVDKGLFMCLGGYLVRIYFGIFGDEMVPLVFYVRLLLMVLVIF